jgi:hypothetical protein
MRFCHCLILTASLLLTGGCCQEVDFTPERPAKVRGWARYEQNGTLVVGEFLLKEGESVDNGLIGVELTKVRAPQKCNEPFAENLVIPHASLRFFDVKSKQTILETLARQGATERLINSDFPAEKYGVGSVLVREINTREKWVWFELTK